MKNWKQTAGITIALGIVVSTGMAQAAEKAGTTSIGAVVGRMDYDSDRGVKDTTTYGITLSHNITDQWAVEGIVTSVDSDAVVGAQEVDALLYGISALYHFETSNKLQPYLSAGLSSLIIDTPANLSGTDTGFSFGAGLKYALKNNLILRGDIRSMRTKDQFNDLSYMVGLAYTFGKTSAPVAKLESIEVMSVDSDKDGVYDKHDRCPNTPMGVAVDSRGCPIMETGNVGVDLNVEFDTDKSDIKSIYNARIGEVTAFMKQYPATTAVIEGHTDNRGSDSYNNALSQRRADSVRNYMIEQESIAADRLEAIGYGEDRPIADNATAAGQQKNRRVMAVINTQVREMKKR